MLHLVHLDDMLWQPHPTIAGVQTKVFENRNSQSLADALMARIMPGESIPWHIHPDSVETAYVLQGQGKLLYTHDADHKEVALEANLMMNCALTITAGVWHSILNTADEPLILFAFHVPPTL